MLNSVFRQAAAAVTVVLSLAAAPAAFAQTPESIIAAPERPNPIFKNPTPVDGFILKFRKP